MPATNFPEYAQRLAHLLDTLVTRPGIGGRMGHHGRAHRIQFDIPRAEEKVPLSIHWLEVHHPILPP
jgi:hypothetical protein